ncbi:MAG: Asp-tRNA(Asn)/Glu-tRNA(Gln) amidotransferase subunit GatB [Candidatus Omnitrophica bacterium]|nr:Asp-tRNA(Asn)/Glu-tRNA(Gln) amidotransferase subunit GatB [Candidatus Omnitrophota bacterium]
MPDEKKQFETVIGLEVHLQLKTKSKIFCGCKNTFGGEPNTQTCPVCLGLPGSLPVLNRKVLEYAIKTGLALNCKINSFIKFDRKNYYYPDLPKAYQISQYDSPVCYDGFVLVPQEKGEEKKIRLTRAHLEEDAGKLMHDHNANCSLVDYNRTGTPLLEIVTQPDIRSAQEAYDYLQILKLTLQYLDVSDCDMEKGSLRCDANISLRVMGEEKLGVKTELKNMNSFKAVKSALLFEERRQEGILQSGGKITQETRLWDENKQMTFTMRSKEEAHDYRYFPDPDLVPFVIEEKAIKGIAENLPELPFDKCNRIKKEYDLSDYDAWVLVGSLETADFFEACAKLHRNYKSVCNWISGPLLQEANARKTGISGLKIEPKRFVEIVKKSEDGSLSNLGAKDVLKQALCSDKSIEQIISEKGLAQVSDDATLEKIADEVIKANLSVVEQIKSGDEKPLGFLVGQAMKKTQGKANPKKIGEIIKRRL